MDFDLIQLIDDDDDDQLLEVAEPQSAASEQVPVPAAHPTSSIPSSSQPPPAAASAAQTHRVNVPAPASSQPPTYNDSNRLPRGPPVEGCLRISLFAVSVLFVIISVISVVINIVGIIYCSHFAIVGYGVWTAIVVINTLHIACMFSI